MAVLMLASLIVPVSHGATIIVCHPDYFDSGECDYDSIQDAINASSSGDTIEVRGYTEDDWYEESIIVTGSHSGIIIKGVKDLAYGTAYPQILPPTAATPVPAVVLDRSCTFKNFHISRDTGEKYLNDGICVTSPSIVKNCDVENQRYGVVSPCASNPDNDDPPVIDLCELHGNQYGYVSGETEQILQYCSVHGNTSCGVKLSVGSCARIFSNAISSNEGHGILIEADDDNNGFAEISNNHIEENDSDGIYIDKSTGSQALMPVIRDNMIGGNGGYGVNCSVQNSGCYPTLRYNNVYSNSSGAYHNTPTGDSTRAVHSYTDGTTCVDAGSLTLEPGESWCGSGGADTGILDLGGHTVLVGPMAPESLSAREESPGLTLSWTAPSLNQDGSPADDIAHYIVVCSTVFGEQIARRLTGAAHWTFTDLPNSGTVVLSVQAVNSLGVGGETATLNVSL